MFLTFLLLCLTAPTVARISPPAFGTPSVVRVETVAGAPSLSTVSGFLDGNGTNARLNSPINVEIDPDTNIAYFSDYTNCAIRAYNTSFYVSTVAGSPPSLGAICSFQDAAVGTNARFRNPWGLSIHAGVLYVADANNNMIRAVFLNNYSVTTIAGWTASGYIDAIGTAAQFYYPASIVYHFPSNSLLIADQSNHLIRSLNLATWAVTTIAGFNTHPPSTTNFGFLDGVGSVAQFYLPLGVAVDVASGTIYVAERGNYAIRAIQMPSLSVTTIAGSYPVTALGFVDGNGTVARFSQPRSIASDPNSGGLVVVDTKSDSVRWVSMTGNVTTIAGHPPPATILGHVDGTGLSSTFFNPNGITVHPLVAGVYIVADQNNNCIRYLYTSAYGKPFTRSFSQTANASASTTKSLEPSQSASLSRSLSSLSASPSESEPTPTATLSGQLTRSGSSSESRTHKSLSRSPSVSRQLTNTSTLTHSRTTSSSTSPNVTTTPSVHFESATTSTSLRTTITQSCDTPTVAWLEVFDLVGNAIANGVPLTPSAPFFAKGTTTIWTAVSLPRSTLQRLSPLLLNVSCTSDDKVGAAACQLRSATLVGSDTELGVAAQSSTDGGPYELLTLTLPPDKDWLSLPLRPGHSAVAIALVFASCDNRVTTNVTVRIGLQSPPLGQQVSIVLSTVGSTTAVVSVTTATTAARVGAVRTLLLCTSDGASTGGLLGLTLSRPSDGSDDDALPAARGGIVGNVLAVCVVATMLASLCVVYSARCGVPLAAASRRLALPSSLLPVLVAALPSTMGAVVYLARTNIVISSSSGGDWGVVFIGAMLSCVTLSILAWIAFVMPSRLGLVLRATNSKRECSSTTSGDGVLATLRRAVEVLSMERWKWEGSVSHSNGASPVKGHVDLLAPQRAGHVVLVEYRLLLFGVLDTFLAGLIAAVGVGGSFGASTTVCSASLIAVVVLLALESVLCVALKPFTTLRSHILAATTLVCTTLSSGLQLVSSTGVDAALLVSAGLDLAVLAMTIARLVVFDAPEMLSASRHLLAEIVAGLNRASVVGLANLRDIDAVVDRLDGFHNELPSVLVPSPCVPLVDEALSDRLVECDEVGAVNMTVDVCGEHLADIEAPLTNDYVQPCDNGVVAASSDDALAGGDFDDDDDGELFWGSGGAAQQRGRLRASSRLRLASELTAAATSDLRRLCKTKAERSSSSSDPD